MGGVQLMEVHEKRFGPLGTCDSTVAVQVAFQRARQLCVERQGLCGDVWREVVRLVKCIVIGLLARLPTSPGHLVFWPRILHTSLRLLLAGNCASAPHFDLCNRATSSLQSWERPCLDAPPEICKSNSPGTSWRTRPVA